MSLLDVELPRKLKWGWPGVQEKERCRCINKGLGPALQGGSTLKPTFPSQPSTNFSSHSQGLTSASPSLFISFQVVFVWRLGKNGLLISSAVAIAEAAFNRILSMGVSPEETKTGSLW